MGAAAAAESPADANNVTMNSIDDATNAVVSEDAGGAESLLGASNDNDLLSANNGIFTDLNEKIINESKYGGTIHLEKDYTFNNDSDSDFIGGIVIKGYVTIDGHDHIIDGNNLTRIFHIMGDEVVLKNIVFKNAYSTSGSAVFYDSANMGHIINCVFENNIATASGAAVYSASSDMLIENCTFNDNTAISNGAAIFASKLITITNCEFNSNIANRGGSIYFNSIKDLSIVDNCKFQNNDANLEGGAICIYSSLINITNSRFVSNKAISGGAISNKFYQSQKVVVSNCYFDGNSNYTLYHVKQENNEITSNNHVEKHIVDYIDEGIIDVILDKDFLITDQLRGSFKINLDGNGHKISSVDTSIFYTNGASSFKNISFENITSYGDYHAALRVSASTIEYCNFTNCRGISSSYSGALFLGGSATVNHCIFKDNYGTMGGGLYAYGGWSKINYCDFINNVANNGGAIYARVQPVFNYCNFINNTALYSGGAVYDDMTIGTYIPQFTNCVFENNTAFSNATYYGELSSKNNNNTWGNESLSELGKLFNSSVINLNEDWNISQNIPISLNNTIINGNNYNIDCNAMEIFLIPDGMTVTLNNINFINTGSTRPFIFKKNIILNNVTFDGDKVDDKFYQLFYNLTDTSTEPMKNQIIYLNQDYDAWGSLTLTQGSNITIDGQNHIIDGHGKSIFTILNLGTTNVKFKNIIFKNFTSAINYQYGRPGDVSNCTFINSSSTVISIISGGTIVNSSFINCSSGNGGAIAGTHGTYYNITQCNFTNCSATNLGGAIYINGNPTSLEVILNDNNFTNCSARNGGAVYLPTLQIDDYTVSIDNNTFIDNHAIQNGASIYSAANVLNVTNSLFEGNDATTGGAIFTLKDAYLENDTFRSNEAMVGGAVSPQGDSSIINNCTFEDNKADAGSSIYSLADNITITNLNSNNNDNSSIADFILKGNDVVLNNITLSNSNGIELDGNNVNLDNVTVKNSASSGIIINGDNVTVKNSNITGSAGNGIQVNGNNVAVLNNTLQGNDGAGLLVNGNGTNITGNTFNSTRDISINPNSDIYNNDTIIDKLKEENYPAGQVEILNDVEPTIIVSDVNVQQNTTFNITILNDDFKGNVSVKLDDGSLLYNGTFNAIKDKDGILVGPVLPVAGEKTVTVFFYGDTRFTNKTVNTTFIVSRVTPQMNITVANVTYGNNSIVEVRIGNKANGTITITIDDVEITSIPIVDGNATCDLGVLPGGNKTANVQFRYNTSDYYNDNVGNFTSFCVDKAESSISIVVNDTYDIGEDVNITVSTTGSSGNLTFKINDTVYNVVNGTVNITGLALGEHVITATLDADENYTNKTVTKTFTIKKINTDLIHLKNTKNK